MDKLIARQVNKNVGQSLTGQQYSIPPPHAHSIISKRETSPMVVNTEIKVSEVSNNSQLHQTSTLQSHQSLSQQHQLSNQQTLISGHNGGSPMSTYSSDGLPSNGNKIVSSETGNLVVSGEHEIKFTKTEGCTPSTCICVFIAILLISIGASSGIFYGLRSYEDALLKDQVFKGQFTVTRGDSYNPEFEKRSSDEFKDTAKKYKTRLDKLFSESGLTKAFRRSEILALEKTPKVRSDDLIVHYNLVFSPLLRPRLSPADVYTILIEEVRADRKKSFKNITIDPNSIDISERKSEGGRRGLFYTSSPSFPASAQFLENPSPWEAKPGFPGLLEGLTTEPTPPPRRCIPIELPFCSNLLEYNYTSYPNIGGHWNLTSLEADLIPYRQIVDAECYPLAREFICQIVQPQCWEDEMVPPCREFCEDFMSSCKDWLVKSITDKLKCKQFPSADEGNSGTTTSSSLTTNSYNGSSVVYSNRDISSHEKLASRLIGRNDEKRLQYKCRVKPGVTTQRSSESIRNIQTTTISD